MGQMLTTAEEWREDLYFKRGDWSVHFLLLRLKSWNGEIGNTGGTKKEQRGKIQVYGQNEGVCL